MEEKMYKRSSQMLVEATRAYMAARTRIWKDASRWINPLWLAPLLMGALALTAPNVAFAKPKLHEASFYFH